ncbi:MAG: O-antigen ligase family protein [Bacteroidales bacterium]|nr:O-antigen ligase family protein [Bacteroidales bacterium]
MKQIIKGYNLFFIFMCIIWPPFQLYILKVDGAGRTIMIMSILALLLNVHEFWKQKKAFLSPAFLCWVVLFCYSMFNALSKGFYAEFGVFKFLRDRYFDSFVLLIFLLLELRKDKNTCLWVIWIALGVYLLIGIPSFTINVEGRFDVEEIGNLYPLHAVAFLFMSCILFVEEKIKMWFFVLVTIGISIIIYLSGTRKAFGAEVILLMGVVLNNGKKRNVWAWIRLVFFGGILLSGVYYVMNYTTVGERIQEGTDEQLYVQLVDNERFNDFLMTLLGDRAVQYETSIELYHEHFWTGIGLTNFMDMSGGELVLHSEYMVQLCENGLIGFVLLMLFYVVLVISLFKNLTHMKRKIGMALFGLLSVLFINFTSWTYCMNYIMVFYAILLTYASSKPELLNAINKDRHPSQREQFQQSLDRIFGAIPEGVEKDDPTVMGRNLS